MQTILRQALSHPSIGITTIDAPSSESRYTGVWCDERHKIASLGVQVQHRITSHGFALNIHRSALEGFAKIVACGLPDVQLTCIDEQLEHSGRHLTLSDLQVAELVATEFAYTLHCTIQSADALIQYKTSKAKDGTEFVASVTIDNEPLSLP